MSRRPQSNPSPGARLFLWLGLPPLLRLAAGGEGSAKSSDLPMTADLLALAAETAPEQVFASTSGARGPGAATSMGSRGIPVAALLILSIFERNAR